MRETSYFRHIFYTSMIFSVVALYFLYSCSAYCPALENEIGIL